jgi:glycerophosphoryl diester phosphodiesterase
MRKPILAASARAATLVLAATLASIPAGAAEAATPCSSLEIQAHRGYHYGGSIDQNTIRSFDVANARGYTIETDVRRDAQGQLWIFHDRDVSKLTNGKGFIDKLTTAQVHALRYRKAGSPVPTFEEAVAAWSDYPTRRIYIEPKLREAVPVMVRQLRNAGLVNNIYFASYWDFVEKRFPDFSTAPKSSPYRPPSNFAKNEAMMTSWRSMTLARTAAYHQAGLEVLHFRSNTTRAWERAISLNFDAIMTDRPDQLRAFCRRL